MGRTETLLEKIQPDFYQFMVDTGGLGEPTMRNYISWLRFLSSFYRIDTTLDEYSIEDILRKEEEARHARDKYARKEDISNFKSALHKFLDFLGTGYAKNVRQENMDEINDTDILTSTEKEIVIKARLVQGAFREKLIRYWRGCAISRCPQVDLLIASHIKPWSLSTDEEKVDVFNGLLLLPHYDKLFDSGYMTFTPEGKVVYSELLSDDVRRILNLTNDLSLCHLEERHKQYLQYHNEYCFKKNRGR